MALRALNAHGSKPCAQGGRCVIVASRHPSGGPLGPPWRAISRVLEVTWNLTHHERPGPWRRQRGMAAAKVKPPLFC